MTVPNLPAQIQQLIDSSGNTFHARVARWFKEAGWHVRVSPYYLDRTQEKAREIDLIVEKSMPIRNSANNLEGDVVIRLFIECKFVAGYTVFWLAERDRQAAEGLVTSTQPFRMNNQVTLKHHYLGDKSVAKIFASEQSRGAEFEWMYKALNQVLNAQTAMVSQRVTIPELQRYKTRTVILNFPAVVCNSFDKIFRTDFFEPSAAKPVEENFQLEVSYAFADPQGTPRDGYFLVDLVEFEQLQSFATAVLEDAQIAVHLLASS
jgi:hypothetical protein